MLDGYITLEEITITLGIFSLLCLKGVIVDFTAIPLHLLAGILSSIDFDFNLRQVSRWKQFLLDCLTQALVSLSLEYKYSSDWH